MTILSVKCEDGINRSGSERCPKPYTVHSSWVNQPSPWLWPGTLADLAAMAHNPLLSIVHATLIWIRQLKLRDDRGVVGFRVLDVAGKGDRFIVKQLVVDLRASVIGEQCP
jgi:hypothetical protein